MRVMVIVKATKDSEAGVLPGTGLLTDALNTCCPDRTAC